MIAFEITRQIVFSGRLITDFNLILLNMTFTFGFVPFLDFIWGGWAVGVEMIFYAIFPVLILTIRTHRSALVLLLMSIMISYFIRSALHTQYLTLTPQPRFDSSYFAFASNMCFFAMGIYAYHVSRIYKESILVKRIIPFLAVMTIGGLMFFDAGQYFKGSGRLDIVIWGLGLMALCVWQSVSPSLLIANRICEYWGERSFSIYLLHPVIIYFSKAHLLKTYEVLKPYIGSYAFFVCAALIIALVLFFAEFSYRLIEVPGIRFGRKLITQWKHA
jgi:peptidoglycan/LPS O-acetylase OafA/YrhL